MNKEVIYIDIDDDVTAIIGKIKSAKEKIVALVPPKRTGVLQSAVNLRLVERMASAEGKHLVLVTNSPALVALASSAKIPVAKNLQSKPEIAEIPALIVDDGDDIIDGGEIAIGDYAGVAKTPTKQTSRSDAIDQINIDVDTETTAPTRVVKVNKTKDKKKPKIPDFNKFRKKLIIAILAGASLVALLVWMFVFAPAATIVITAITNPAPVSVTVGLDETAATDYESGVVRVSKQQKTVDLSVDFTATGEEDIGEEATGVLELTKLVQDDYFVAAGTRFVAGGLGFVTTEAVTIPASVPCFPSYCAQSVEVNVKAENPGTEYNGISGEVSNTSDIDAEFTTATSGGTSKIATVVTAEDIEKAKDSLKDDSEARKTELTELFVAGEKIIDSSFSADRGEISATPAEGEEASDGKAKLTMQITYTLYAVPQGDLKTYLNSYLTEQLQDSQKIYDTGIDHVKLSNFSQSDDEMTVAINTTGRVGPEIDEEVIKEESRGKIYGDVQLALQAQDGIKSVDVEFSYFWVRKVPDDIEKIKVEFEVENE